MKRTRLLQTAVALMSVFPLAAGVVSDTKREPSDEVPSIARVGITGHHLTVQVRSDHERDLELGHHHRGRTDSGSDAALESALKASRGMALALVDQGRAEAGRTTAPVPELSSLLLFAASLLVARTGMKRRGVAAR